MEEKAEEIVRTRSIVDRLLLCSLLLASACQKDAVRGVDGRPEAPGLIDFGVVPIHGRSVRPLSIGNTGGVPLAIQDSSSAEPFAVETQPDGPIDPGSQQELTVSFTPSLPGEITGSVIVLSNSLTNPRLEVQVKGVAFVPELLLSPDRLTFDQQKVGTSASLSFTIQNTTPVPLVPEVQPTAGRADFQASPTGFLGSLAPQQEVRVTVTFSPSVAGSLSSSLLVSCAICTPKLLQLSGVGTQDPPPDAGSPDAGAPDAGLPDSGTPDAGLPDAGSPDAGAPDAGPPPECSLVVAPPTIDFGSQPPGTVAQRTVTYSSRGTGPCFVQQPYLSGADPSFHADPISATTLQPGQSATVALQFSPASGTPRQVSAQLVAVSNDRAASPATVGLRAATPEPPPPPPPPAQLAVSPLALAFAAQAPAAPATQQVQVTNTGGQPLQWTCSSTDPNVTCGAASGGLAAGASSTVTLSVAGQPAAGHRTSVASFAAGAAGSAAVSLDITFTSAPASARLVVSPLSLTFTAQAPAAPATQSLSVSNGGELQLTWTSSSSDPGVAVLPAGGGLAGGGQTLAQVALGAQSYAGTRTSTLFLDAGPAGVATVNVTVVVTSPPAPPPPQYGASVWPKFHHDNGNTGLSLVDTSRSQGVVAHAVPLSPPAACRQLSGIWRCGTYQASPSLAADGTIYQVAGDKYVYAVDPDSGAIKWRLLIGEPMLASAESDITVVKSGHFFVHAHGDGATVPQFFKIADKGDHGEIAWQNTPAGVDASGKRLDGFDSAPAIDYDGDLYLMNEDAKKVGQWDQSAKKLSDTPLAPIGVNAFSHGAALTLDKLAFWSGDGYLWAMNGKSSSLLWSSVDPALGKGAISYSKSSPLITRAGALATSFGWREGSTAATYKFYTRVTAYTPGPVKRQLWTTLLSSAKAGPALPPLDSRVSAAEEIRYNLGVSSPAEGPDGTIYVGHADGLYALDPKKQGALLWGVGTGPVVSSPAVGADGRVYFGSMDGCLYAAKNGAIVWQVKTGGQVNSSPAIAADGAIVAMSDDGKLYLVK